jgi:hypothetical protein
MHQLLNHPDFSKVDLNDLESVSVGANRLRSDLGQTFESRGGDVPFLTEGDDLLEDAFLDRPREQSMSERAVQTLIAIAEPLQGMFRDLVERRRSSTGIPGMNTRGTSEADSEADFGEESALFLHDLAVAVENPDDLLSHSESFTPGSGPGIRQGVVENQDRIFFDVDRVKDRDGVKINGVHLARVSPSEIEKVIREHPEVVDCVVAGVRGARLSDGLVPRAWLVLSDSAKAKGVARMLGAIEEFLRGRLSDQHWLHGGFEVIDEVAIRTLITGGK